MSQENKTERIDKALDEVRAELSFATDKFGPFASPHEGYAVLLEEVDELWEEVQQQYDVRSRERMRKEAKQVAAMALRFMVDLTT